MYFGCEGMKSKTHFHFKKFSVSHASSTMKVGTDAVLLGAWVNVGDASHILDIGTGNGTIALMLAQRTSKDVIIDAIEIEKESALQADENFAQSPWPHKIHLHIISIQKFFTEKKYDLIVSNPPFFNNSQSPPNERRHQARHTILLTYDELIASTLRLLNEQGKFNVILPYTEGLQFIELAKQSNLFCTRQHSFKTREKKPVERWLLEFSRSKGHVDIGEILLYKSGDEWSDSYTKLTQDFYLKL
jgi:tRNA1Val (adenine37-N6)-methyltransferase